MLINQGRALVRPVLQGRFLIRWALNYAHHAPEVPSRQLQVPQLAPNVALGSLLATVDRLIVQHALQEHFLIPVVLGRAKHAVEDYIRGVWAQRHASSAVWASILMCVGQPVAVSVKQVHSLSLRECPSVHQKLRLRAHQTTASRRISMVEFAGGCRLAVIALVSTRLSIARRPTRSFP